MALRDQNGLRSSSLPSVVTEAMAINTDPGCCKAMDPDMAPDNSPGPDGIMSSTGSTGHSDQHGPGGSMVLEHQMAIGGGPHLGIPKALVVAYIPRLSPTQM